MLILSYENEFNLNVKEISLSYERMSTKARFEEEAKGNSEMAYCFMIHKRKKYGHDSHVVASSSNTKPAKTLFTITAETLARSLANLYM